MGFVRSISEAEAGLQASMSLEKPAGAAQMPKNMWLKGRVVIEKPAVKPPQGREWKDVCAVYDVRSKEPMRGFDTAVSSWLAESAMTGRGGALDLMMRLKAAGAPQAVVDQIHAMEVAYFYAAKRHNDYLDGPRWPRPALVEWARAALSQGYSADVALRFPDANQHITDCLEASRLLAKHPSAHGPFPDAGEYLIACASYGEAMINMGPALAKRKLEGAFVPAAISVGATLRGFGDRTAEEQFEASKSTWLTLVRCCAEVAHPKSVNRVIPLCPMTTARVHEEYCRNTLRSAVKREHILDAHIDNEIAPAI